MADSFLRFSTDINALGAGKIGKMELLTADVEEEAEYDALNDETFGMDAAGECEDWEEDHEKFAELVDKSTSSRALDLLKTFIDYRPPNLCAEERNNVDYNNELSQYLQMPDHDEEKDIAESISQLVLDDDMDDPAIMNISRSRLPKPDRRLPYSVSPPPPAIVETDIVGSPSTSSIWSTSHISAQSLSSKTNPSIVTRFSYMKRNHPVVHDVQFEDPSIISATKIVLPNTVQDIGPKLIPNVKTLEELERDLLLASSKNKSPVVPKAHLLDDVERDILLKPRVRTVSEIEQDIANAQSQSSQKSSHQGLLSSRFVNGQARTPLTFLGDRNGLSTTSFPQNVTSVPMAIPGHDMGRALPESGHMSPPPLLTPASMASPPQHLLGTSTFPNMGSPLRGQQYMTRLIPPQLTTVQRNPYLNHVASGQPLLVGRMRYPPVQSGHPLPAGLFGYPPPQFPVNFTDPRNMCRYPPHPMNNQVRPRFPHKRSSWSESSNNFRHNSLSHLRDSNEEVDEYANLMSQKEKDWLIKIQMMQLQTDNPYLDDYYYTTFMLNKRIKASKANLKSQEPTLVIPERSKAESKVYQPAHYEGSLGKLQVLSVNCPRRIIDLDIVHPEESETEQQKVRNRELKRFRQLLLEIEKIYALFLEIDDLDKKAAALPEEARIPHYEHKDGIILKVYNSLTQNGKEHLGQIITIRKGRKLVCRVLPLFSKGQIIIILGVILSSFSVILKRDAHDQVLPTVLDYFSSAISSITFSQIVELGSKLWDSIENEPSSTALKSQSSLVLQTEFGVGIISKLVMRAEELYQTDGCNDSSLRHKWCLVVLHVTDILSSLSDEFTAQPKILYSQLVQHCKRFTEEYSKFDAFREKCKHLRQLETPGTESILP